MARIKYAENPPKKYQDIYPIDFAGEDAGARAALWQEWKRIFEVWIGRGVKIFRVDNPHTKPIPFWAWLIREIQRDHPEVIFLSEAFTKPKMMRQLAKVGFTQSYTYFTWRESPGGAARLLHRADPVRDARVLPRATCSRTRPTSTRTTSTMAGRRS